MTLLSTADRVQETAQNIGSTVPIVLLGSAGVGLQTFAAAVPSLDGKIVPYAIEHETSGQWEVGSGLYTASTKTLLRTTVYSNSSGSTSPINFAVGIVDVWVDLPSEVAVTYDVDATHVSLRGGLSVTGAVDGVTTLLTSGAITSNATGSQFSAGSDASTDVSIGSGGVAPSASRTASLSLNAPDSGSFRGAAQLLLKRAASIVFAVGLFSSVAGAMTANTDLVAQNSSGTNVAAITQAGQLTVAQGLVYATYARSTTAASTPAAMVATTATLFAGSSTGASLMGFGTTYDLSLVNRAGTVVIGIGPNSTQTALLGALSVAGVIVVNGQVTPQVDNTYALGTASFRWSDLRSNTATFSGAVTTGLINGQTISSAANFTGSVTVANTFTVSAGFVGIGTNAGGNVGLNVTQTMGAFATVYGIQSVPTMTSATTGGGGGFYTQVVTQAAAFTMTQAAGIYIDTPSKGAGSAITTLYGIFIASQPSGGTNYSWYAATTGTNNSWLTNAGTLQANVFSFANSLMSTTSFAGAGVLSATEFLGYANSSTGATVQGFGTTNDVTIMNRAGTQVLTVGPNTTLVTVPGSLVIGSDPGGAQLVRIGGSVKIDVLTATTGMFAGSGLSTPPTVLIGTAGSGGGGANSIVLNYEANASSRSWRIGNDALVFGDFAIQQSTTREGTTYVDMLNIDPTGAVTLSSTLGVTGLVTFTGGATVAAGQELKLGNARQAGVLVQGGSVTMRDSAGTLVTVLTT